MKVLAVNCGSSTLKFQLFDIESAGRTVQREQKLASGIIDRIGGQGEVRFSGSGDAGLREAAAVTDHGEAIRRVLAWLDSLKMISSSNLAAIGHRVVHGGHHFKGPALINDEVIGAIEAISQLAPLHNAPALSVIRTTRNVLGTEIPQVASFDTSFHATLTEEASTYAIPLELTRKYHIRRYGFHGLAHRYMTERYAAITGMAPEKTKLITLQLGNGCSATAACGGRSIDTSMGFTPLEGLLMGTRSGDLDPSIVSFLAQQEKVAAGEVESWLNTRSGLLGVSGRSRDMRELLQAEHEGDDRARRAVEMFCYRVRKYIGAYTAVLNGIDGIVFGGGIGENSPEVRKRICRGMDWCGLVLDDKRNAATTGTETRISAGHSRVSVYVVTVDEGMIITRDTARCLNLLWQGGQSEPE